MTTRTVGSTEQRLSHLETIVGIQRESLASQRRSIRYLSISCALLMVSALASQATSCMTTLRMNRIEGVAP